MKTAYTLFIYLLFAVPVTAQEILVNLKVLNQKDEPVPSASMLVINRADSMKRTSVIADSYGRARVNLFPGQYIVRLSAVNYQPLEKGITVSSSGKEFIFILEPLSKSLREVVVTASKPLIRQEDDKTIIDPEVLVSSSTTGYEVIEKTPGLFVDQDGNIYISSLSPAAVQVNGRELKMSAADIATMLKSLPPNAITRIEIVRTPSAKYDASGTGGIVNVVLRKGVKIGLTGSVNTGWQQGVYANNFLGFNLNNNNGSKTSYLNLNVGRRNSYERIITHRRLVPDSVLSQDALTKYPGKTAFAGYGWGYEWKEKWEFNYDGRTSLNDFNNYTDSRARVSHRGTGDYSVSNQNEIWNNGYSLLNNNGLALKYKIDTSGSEWTSDASFTYSFNNNDQAFHTIYFSPPMPGGSGDGHTESNRKFFTAQTDLKKKFHRLWTVETGVKSTLLGFKSVAGYFRTEQGVRFEDPARTNTYRYNENINSFYLQASKTIKTIVIKGGARFENTNMKGRQIIPDDTSFNVHRTDLFPYLYLSRKVMSIAGYELRGYIVYRRSITRPVYEQLNPFPRYVNEYMTEVGNPAVRPQFTTNYEFNISVDERPIIAAGINKTKDIFTTVVYQSDTSAVQTFRTTDNLGNNKEWYARALGAIPPGKKYFFVLGTQYNHNFYQGQYSGKPFSYKRGTWTFFTYHSLKLGKLSQFSMHGFMRLKGQQQFYELGSFGSLYASINRQFLKQKLIVTVSMADIFGTNKNDFIINQDVVNATGTRSADTRRFGINLRYNFGIRKKEENNNYLNIDPERSN